MVDKLRSSFARALRPGDTGGCPITTVGITIGIHNDPWVKTRLELFDAWFDHWDDAVQEGHQDEVRAAWRASQRKVLLETCPRRRWQTVTGPLAAVQVALTEIGWKPAAPDIWIDRGGSAWSFIVGCRHGLRNSIVEDVSDCLWKRAAGHEDGAGMEQGVDLDATCIFLRSLAKKHLPQRGLLEALLNGATWTNGRKHAAMPNACPTPNCSRCTLGGA